MGKKAVIVVTGFNDTFYPDGAKTGLFYSEGLHPFEVLSDAGYEVTIASENGKVGVDEHSISSQFLNEKEMAIYKDPNSAFNVALKNIKKTSELDPKEYAIFYAAGGHGTVFDFETAAGIQKLGEGIYSNGGVVAAVCHGPMALTGMKGANGEPLIKGKKVAGFMDEGEEIMGLSNMLKEKKLGFVKGSVESSGAIFQAPQDPWADFAVADGKIVTGTNPASATSVAKKALELV